MFLIEILVKIYLALENAKNNWYNEGGIIIETKKLNLKNDLIFKTFFSRKGNEKFLIDFLEALLKIEIKKIAIQEEVNLEKLSEIEKGGRLDIQAQLDNGYIINIEMQVKNEHNIERRSDIYASKTISRYFQRGEKYQNCKQVIMINILDFNLFGFDEYVSKTVTVLDKHRDFDVDSISETYYIELPKFRKAKPDINEKLNQWLLLWDDENREEIEMAEKKNKIIKDAKIELGYLTGDAEVQRLAELRAKWESDWNSSMEWARTDGKEEGRIAGIEQGRKEGKLENQKEIAKKMLKKNMEIEDIQEITGLSKKEIEKLR